MSEQRDQPTSFPTDKDEFHGQGGNFIFKDGRRVRVDDAPAAHKDGNAPRDRHGRRLDANSAELPAPSAADTKVRPLRGKPAQPGDE